VAPAHDSWHFRKEVTLGTVIALLVYGVSFLMIVAKMDARLAALEAATVPQERIAIVETRVAAAERNLEQLEIRTIRSLDEIKMILQRIEQRQERMAQ
jgi:hypothetical protein